MDHKRIIKHYIKGDLTIVWDAGKCTHSTMCWKKATGLPEVFNPMIKPWINLDNYNDLDRIREQVRKCPSGALSLGSTNDQEKTTG